MPRAISKKQLLTAMQKEHGKLTNLLATLSPETLNQSSKDIENWAVKDVLTHVTAWEQMVISWYQAGLQGDVPELPAPGFNWRQIPALNQQIYEQHQMGSSETRF